MLTAPARAGRLATASALLALLLFGENCSRSYLQPPLTSRKSCGPIDGVAVENEGFAGIEIIHGYFPPRMADHWETCRGLVLDIGSEEDAKLPWLGDRFLAPALRTLCEPPLWPLAKRPTASAYRLFHERSFSPNKSLRVDASTDPPTLRLAEANRPSQFGAQLAREITLPITRDEVVALSSCLKNAGFWAMQTVNCVLGNDGNSWLVEAVEDGRYHVVDRWAPGYEAKNRGLTALIGCGEQMENLAQEKLAAR